MNAEPVNAVTLFYCYAHEDEPLRDELEKHLAAFKRSGHISSWHDRQIQAGSEWQQEIETHLTAAHLILLLISPDFIYSDACDAEMQKALVLHHAGHADRAATQEPSRLASSGTTPGHASDGHRSLPASRAPP